MNHNIITSLANRIAFYLSAFFTGIVVLPATGAVGMALMFGGAVSPIAALIKLIAEMLGYDVPISLFDTVFIQFCQLHSAPHPRHSRAGVGWNGYSDSH